MRLFFIFPQWPDDHKIKWQTTYDEPVACHFIYFSFSSPPDRLIRLVGIEENKENRRRTSEKLLLIDLFSCTFAWFKFWIFFFLLHLLLVRVADFFFFSWKLLMQRDTLIKLWDNLPTLASYCAIFHPWLSAFPCNIYCCKHQQQHQLSTVQNLIFPWNLARSSFSTKNCFKHFPRLERWSIFGDEIFGQMHFARHLIAFWGKNNEFVSIVEFSRPSVEARDRREKR